MITSYLPTLNKPSHNSADWYIRFHQMYYLSQLTGLTLLSYMESFIEINSKDLIIVIKREELLKKKIIKQHGERIFISKKEEFKSIDVEDFLSEIIQTRFKNRFNEMQDYMMLGGTVPDKSLDRDVDIDINKLLKTTNSKSWYGIIKGFLNTWEFLFLYSVIETNLKLILNKKGVIREEDLITELVREHEDLKIKLEDGLLASLSAINDIWSLYTELRNIYAHSHGFITTQDVKNNISGKIDKFRKALDSINSFEFLLFDSKNLFKANVLQKDKFYLMQDEELNIFRNIAVFLMESLDEVHRQKSIRENAR